MKLQQQQMDKKEKQYDEYIWKMEREQDVEKLVRKKLEMEKMREQQTLMDDVLRKKDLELQMVAIEVEKKDESSGYMLKKALLRAEVLQKQIENGALDMKTQGLLVESILNKNPENEMIRK